MNLKNEALQELYNTLLYGPILSSPYTESPIDRAFKECDEKLSGSAAFAHIKDLENRCENLERSNKALRDDNDKVSDKAIELAKKNEQLENEIEDLKKDLDTKTKENSTLVSANADLSDRLAKLQRNFDRINHLWTGQIQENMELRSKITNMQQEKKNYETIAKERENLVKERDEARQDRDAWQRRAKYAEKELDLAKRNKDGWRRRAEESEKRFGELLLKKYDQSFEDLRKERDRYSGLYTELKKDYDRLFEENRSLKEKVVDLKKSITELQKKGDDLSKKCEDLKKLINSVYGTTTRRLADALRKNGMYELWRMLQEVGDSTYSERLGYFQDVCDIDDLVEWDLEDFLNEYNEWQKKKEKKERDCDRCEMKNPTFYFDNHPVKMNTETLTLEGTMEINKDLLNTVLGVKPNEEEHKLDYGDAVRVPWKNYDYMYIGPEGKHIRLFDPKTHSVVLVSVTDNLTYQGCKIILCDEDDIRKIWKDKK